MYATRTQPYTHAAREWPNPDSGRIECRVCGEPLTGYGDTLRHQGEVFRPTVPATADAAAFDAAWNEASRALEDMLTDRVNDRDRARAVVERLYACGALRPRRSQWR
ncbi:hypothetical protein AB0B89_36455, partial [Sphaerisporangium sp. NPDC049002]|uniref:hypothetical protein n=1 Tax=Sphaerisporangium sp. NPDC049002 TaxID=3155392 RepID=UPI0033DEC5F3